jgi:EmrB/QacA subfamily drug resistance transporter
MLNPVAMSIISNVFTDDKERARAIGIWSGVFDLSIALGPMIGGLLIGASLGWRSIFWVSVPIGIVAIILTARIVPESRAVLPRRIDPLGQALVIIFLTSLTYAIIEGPSSGWASPSIVGCFTLAIVTIVALVLVEQRQKEPLLDLRFFSSVPFSGATVVALCAFAAMGGFALMTTIYLQDVRGYSALRTGLLFLPMAGAAILFGPLSGRLVAKRGPRLSLVMARVSLAVCAFMLTGLTAKTSIGWLLASYAMFGLSFGMVSPPITNTALSGMPRDQAGVAAAIFSTGRQVGQTLGVAVAGSVIASRLHGPLPAGFPAASHASWWVITGYGITVALLGLVITTKWAGRTAVITAQRVFPEES